MFTRLFFSQNISGVEVYGLEEIDIKIWKKNLDFKNFTKEIAGLRKELIADGYLSCSIDSVSKIDSIRLVRVYFYLGEKYNLSSLKLDSLSTAALHEQKGVEYWSRVVKLKPKQVVKMMESVLDYYENNGYPFVSLKIDSLIWVENSLFGNIVTSLGPRIKIGKLIIKSEVEFDESFLGKLLNINEGDLFSLTAINSIENRIKEVPYYEISAPTEYEIINSKCDVYVYLKLKNANSFNAILGILPSDNGQINITGDVKVKLQNALKKGELIDFNWRKLLPLTQNLNIKFVYPYLLGSSFGIDTKFDLYKKDTSYLDLNSRFGITYSVSPEMSVNLFYNNKTSSLLSTEKYEFASTLPPFADVRTNSYGVVLKYENLNYLYNPVSGWDVNIEGGVGDKLIKKNQALNSDLYEGIKLKSLMFSFSGVLRKFNKIGKRSTILTGLEGGSLISDNIFENELYRLGGQRTIKGFDDESLFASSFAIATLEYRFILEENSNIFIFSQAMYYEKKVRESYLKDLPYSFGLGINFQTKPGIFSVSYSLGSQLSNPIQLRSAKIHFGFVNYF